MDVYQSEDGLLETEQERIMLYFIFQSWQAGASFRLLLYVKKVPFLLPTSLSLTLFSSYCYYYS
jgi:hypothetical protein